MSQKRNETQVACEYFRWRLHLRNGLDDADGRGAACNWADIVRARRTQTEHSRDWLGQTKNARYKRLWGNSLQLAMFCAAKRTGISESLPAAIRRLQQQLWQQYLTVTSYGIDSTQLA
jgi:hypothetical protein